MIVNITLNYLLIPKFSYIAASFNTLITEFIILALVMIMAYRAGYISKRKKLIADSTKITISALIMGLFIWEFKDLNLLILIIISSAIYLIILWIIGGLDSEDIEIIKNIKKS